LIRPAIGLSVGLYLDGRPLRAWVREQARGLTVLNTFAYTCAFGIAAASGGAVRAVNLDISPKVLEWGKENMRLNLLDPQQADFIVGDVFDWLGRFGKRKTRFDLLILDPPSFSTTRRSSFSAASDYGHLIERASLALAPGGRLLACCNLANLKARRFEALVMDGLARARRAGRVEQRLGPSPVDFPMRGEPALKAIVVRA
jgi:23S rRNA (cytosine1962-C5)-methyltransferase